MGKITERIGGLATAYLVGSVVGDAIRRDELRKQRRAMEAKAMGIDPDAYNKRMSDLDTKFMEAGLKRQLGK